MLPSLSQAESGTIVYSKAKKKIFNTLICRAFSWYYSFLVVNFREAASSDYSLKSEFS